MRILGKARSGDERARDELVTLVYDELRQVAGRLTRRERRDHTPSPNAVVHDAVIRLLRRPRPARAGRRCGCGVHLCRRMEPGSHSPVVA
jgi:hypothetical protein